MTVVNGCCLKISRCVCVCFRPGMLTVRGQGSSQVCVQVPPVLLQKILEAPPDKLHRSSGEVSRHSYGTKESEQTHL